MESDDVLTALPDGYAEALRLRARGVSAAEIAARLDIPADSVAPLLSLAVAKLARLVGRTEDTAHQAEETHL